MSIVRFFSLSFFSADRYDFYNSDIFATNVIAKDPYTGRQVNLIDSRGLVAADIVTRPIS